MQEDKMLTIEEVAEQLRVNSRTVRAWIQAGELPAFPIGKRGFRISERDLHIFVEARKQRLQKHSGERKEDT